MEQAVRTLLTCLGEDVSREGLLDTPKRVAKAMMDMSTGYHQTAAGVLGTAYFHERIVHDGGEGLVLVRDIDFASTSEETLLPFHGRAHIGYVPRQGVVLGLSKLARLTRMFAKRLQSQECLGLDLAFALERHLQSQGVAVVLQARHLTMLQPEPEPMRTTACVSGCFTDPASSTFQELLGMLGMDDVSLGALRVLPSRVPSPAGDSCSVQHVRRSLTGLSTVSSAGSDRRLALEPSSSGSGGSPQPVPSLLRQGGAEPRPPATPDLSELDCGRSLCSGATGGSCSSGSQGGLLVPDDEEGEEVGWSTQRHGGEGDREHSLTRRPLLPPSCSCSDGCSEGCSDGCGVSSDDSEALAVSARRWRRQRLALTPLAGLGRGRPQQAGPLKLAPEPAPPTPISHGGALGPGPVPHVAPRSPEALDAMERAVQTLVEGIGEHPARPGLLGSARRYASSLLAATAGYALALPAPLASPPAPSPCQQHPQQEPQQGQGQVEGQAHELIQQHQQQDPQQGQTKGHDQAQAWRHLRHLKVPFTSQCEHHMLPFYGHAHVVYSRPSGASADADQQQEQEQNAVRQVVQVFTQRLQVQERITHQVADGVAYALGCGRSSSPAGHCSVGGVLVLLDAGHMCMVARGVENHAGRTTSMAVRGEAAVDAAWRARALALCRSAGVA